MLHGPLGQLIPRAETELAECASHVGLHGAIANHEPLRDLAVGQPFRDQHNHVPFARGEIEWARRGGSL